MNNQTKPRLSLKGEAPVPITAPIEQPLAEINVPTQEKSQELSASPAEISPGPSAKELAALEEAQAVAALAARKAQDEQIPEPVSIIGLAAQGREVLLEELRKHAERTAKPAYVPPPMTERQMTQREKEFEAGRKAQAKHQAQFDSRPVPKKDPSEGLTTPVYRPGDHVPKLDSRDPAIR